VRLGNHPAPVELLLKQPHTTQLQIAPEDLPHHFRFSRVNDQASLARFVPQRDHPTHPKALAPGDGDFVANSFPSHLTLELRAREQHVECKPAHGGRGVKLLHDRDEGDVMLIEELDHFRKIRQRAGQPVNLVHYHHFDEPLADIAEQVLERRALHARARDPTVIVMSLDQPPPLTRLALDKCLACLALGVEGIEVLLQPFLGRLAGVDGAAPEHGVSVFHDRSPLSALSARRSAAPTSGSR